MERSPYGRAIRITVKKTGFVSNRSKAECHKHLITMSGKWIYFCEIIMYEAQCLPHDTGQWMVGP